MKQLVALWMVGLVSTSVFADAAEDRQAIQQATLDYIESQHKPEPSRMDRALHAEMKKRTYWKKGAAPEHVMETSRETMLWVAENYNKDGTAFPKNPRKQVQILDIDGRVASVKLTADDWIDYLHLMKTEDGTWQIINVLWQFHDQSKHVSAP